MICSSIREKNMENALSKLGRLPGNYDLAEIWINEIENLNLSFLLSVAGTEKLLIKFTENTPKIAKECLKAGVKYCDFDITKMPAEILKIKGNDQKIIISFHDFEKTPFYSDAVEIVKNIKEKGADIAKVIFTATKISDNLIPLKLLSEKEILGIPIISFCMGERGEMSRIYAPKFGCEINFVAPDQSWITAQGQPVKEEWDKIQNLLK